MILSDNHKDLVDNLKGEIYPWRKYLIAIDGITGSGKSGLARYLALELDMPAIETDMLRNMNETQPSYRIVELGHLIQSRHELDRPVIVEGVFLLDTLKKLEVEPDYLIYVENTESDVGYALRESLPAYLNRYKSKERANYVFNTDFANM